MKEFAERFLARIRELTGREDINLDTRLDETNIESLQFIELMIDMEKTFNVKIPDEKLDISEFESLAQLAELVYELMQKSGV